MEWIVVTLASGLAGFVDAMVGGGGLILVPVMFATFAQAPAATLFGTNKATAVLGTGSAAWQYTRRVQLRWASLLPALLAATAGSFAGAWAVTLLPTEHLRKLLPVVLTLVLLYTLSRKDFGQHHRPLYHGHHETAIMVGMGAVIGFYDGFFGPGTGSFFVFLFVRLLGYDFFNASASAKLLNVGTNVAAVILFGIKGHVWWHLALPMAAANIAGNLLGARLAMRRGTGFVRIVFIIVVSALILKTGYDAFLR
jgi:uncharacterized protein